jgi:hypothetical protein
MCSSSDQSGISEQKKSLRAKVFGSVAAEEAFRSWNLWVLIEFTKLPQNAKPHKVLEWQLGLKS